MSLLTVRDISNLLYSLRYYTKDYKSFLNIYNLTRSELSPFLCELELCGVC